MFSSHVFCIDSRTPYVRIERVEVIGQDEDCGWLVKCGKHITSERTLYETEEQAVSHAVEILREAAAQFVIRYEEEVQRLKARLQSRAVVG